MKLYQDITTCFLITKITKAKLEALMVLCKKYGKNMRSNSTILNLVFKDKPTKYKHDKMF